MNGRRIYMIMGKLVLTAAVVVGAILLVGAVKTKDLKPCSKVLVHYMNEPESGFVREQDILDSIRQYMEADPIGIALHLFDLKYLEMKLEQHPWVYDAQLYFDNTQTLHVELLENRPVARVMDVGGNHFYLDESAVELPLSKTFRADLPVFTGVPIKRDKPAVTRVLKRMCKLAKVITLDSFWLAQAAQIDVLPDGKMELIPTIGNHVVDLGYATEPEAMLLRLKYFYKAIASAGRLDDYVRLNASYAGQIVGQRGQFDADGSGRREAMNTYRKIVEENKTTVNANSVVNEQGVGRIIKEAAEKEKPESHSKQEAKPEIKTSPTESPPATGKPPDAAGEKKAETKEDKVPKAIMPKTEGN